MSLDLITCARLSTDSGFATHDQVPHFGATLDHVIYLHRQHACPTDAHCAARHTYISLITYEGRLVEVACETYVHPKNTRAPKGRATKAKDQAYTDHQLKGFAAIGLALIRSDEDLASFLRESA